jgi:mannitol/fructose-specific phosphotransferase system IIA component (Ntr-type)
LPKLRCHFNFRAVLLSQLLTADRIKVPLESRDKPSVLSELVDLLATTAGGNAGDILHAVHEREAAQSTGFGHGIAIPHGRTPSLQSLALVAGRTLAPIEYGAVDGQPVRLLFMVAGPEAAAGDQVRVLARIARLVRRDYLRERLLKAQNGEDFATIVREAER